MTEPEYFRRMYGQSDDPWGFDVHFYEQRKRDLTVAMLPHPHYGSVLELGSSTGALSEQLLPRSGHLHCVELHPRGVELARERLQAEPGRVSFEVADIATWSPPHAHDLVVVSEVLYYLDAEPLDRVIGWLRAQLDAGATVITVDWRHPVPEHRWTGDEIHGRLAGTFPAASGVYRDTDAIIEVFVPPGTESVAVRDGLAPPAEPRSASDPT